MASRKWFLDYLCDSVAKSFIRECCSDMELTPLEIRLVLERFCDKKGMLACEGFYSVDCQKSHLPILDKKGVAGALFWRDVFRF